MVERKYVLILCIAEALRSETAFVAGIKRTNLMRRVTFGTKMKVVRLVEIENVCEYF